MRRLRLIAFSAAEGKGVIKRGMGSNSGERTRTDDPCTAVQDIIREMSPAGMVELQPETTLVAELGFDSLGVVELLVALEDALDLPPLDEHALAGVDRVADVERIVREAKARMPSE
jgi:acyl carrier protein